MTGVLIVEAVLANSGTDGLWRFLDVARTPESVYAGLEEVLRLHTSGALPGTAYCYDGRAYGRLTEVVKVVTGRPFAAALADRIIRPLGLSYTAPDPRDSVAFAASGRDGSAVREGMVGEHGDVLPSPVAAAFFNTTGFRGAIAVDSASASYQRTLDPARRRAGPAHPLSVSRV